MQGKVEICGINTSKLQTLSNAEMMRLIERSQAGDQAARERLIEGNLRLVLSVIQRFLGRGENPDDLFQVGCVGLLKAIANFDTTKNVRFSTYGVPMIAGELRRYLRDYSPIRVSRSLRDTAYRVLQCRQQLTDANGREPSIDEIAQALDLPPAQITAALDAITAPGLFRGRRRADCHGSGARPEEHRRAVDRIHHAARGHFSSVGARKAHSGLTFRGRPNADGGRRPDRHLAGTGVAP